MPKRLTIEQFIKKVKVIHGNVYDYSLVEYKNAHTKVKIICPEHGIFEQKSYHHLRGQGCPECRYIKSGNKLRSTTEQFIKKAKVVHGNKYDYSLVDYKNNKTKVKIICHEHGIFEQTPNHHLSGNGCSKCGVKDYQRGKCL